MSSSALLTESGGQGWNQLGELGVAVLLSALIGLEREVRQKSAGIRTYTVVGLGSALFMLISKYGFTDVLEPDRVTLDPSRVAAQIVSGLGFIGAGIIFVRGGSVRGLTSAASVWLTAAVAAAAAAGLELLAVVTTASYFAAIFALTPLARWLRRTVAGESPTLSIDYVDGQGALRGILRLVTRAGFTVTDLRTFRQDGEVVRVVLRVAGSSSVEDLVHALLDERGVVKVAEYDPEEPV